MILQGAPGRGRAHSHAIRVGQVWECLDLAHQSEREVVRVTATHVKLRIVRGRYHVGRVGRYANVPLSAFTPGKYRYLRG